MRRLLLPEVKIKSKIENDRSSVNFSELEPYIKDGVVVVQVVLNKLDISTINNRGIISIEDGQNGYYYYIPNGAVLTIQKNIDDVIVAANILGDDDQDEIREIILFENFYMSELFITANSSDTLFDVYVIEQD